MHRPVHITPIVTALLNQSTTLLFLQMQPHTAVTASLIHIYLIQMVYIRMEKGSYLKNGDIPSMMRDGYNRNSNDRQEKHTFRVIIKWENLIYMGRELA